MFFLTESSPCYKIKQVKGGDQMATSCETCAYYEYDEYFECYVCAVNLDEDDMQKFLSGNTFDCPYWQSDDEYAIVRKQN